jgi:predicted ArsR family transcriptional regulator
MTQIETLKAIADRGPTAITDLPASRNTFYALRDKKLVKRAGFRSTGARGRPAKLYQVSAKGERKLAQVAQVG